MHTLRLWMRPVAVLVMAIFVAATSAGCLPPVVAAIVLGVEAVDKSSGSTNTAPTVVINSIARSETGTVTIPLTVVDANGDTVTLALEYDTGDGSGFREATGTITGDEISASASGVQTQMLWTASTDLGMNYTAQIRVRITPSDGKLSGTPAQSAPFSYGNDAPELLTVDVPPAIVTGIVVVRFTVRDSAADPVTISAVEISRAGDFSDAQTIPLTDTHFPLGLTSHTTSTDGAGAESAIVWNSAQIAPEDRTGVRIRLRVADNSGTSAFVNSQAFALDNSSTAPQISLISGPTAGSTQTGTVSIQYAITDADSDSAFIVPEVSTDGGNSWSVAAGAGTGDPTFGLSTSPVGVPHTFDWNSQQLGLVFTADVQLRIQVGDTLAGNQIFTAVFDVNNAPSPAPTVTIDNFAPTPLANRMAGRAGDYIDIMFTLSDLDAGQTVDVDIEYSPDGGTTFFACTAHASSPLTVLTDLAAEPGGTQHNFFWEPFADSDGAASKGLQRITVDSDGDGTDDLDVIDFLAGVIFRITPRNSPPENTQGNPAVRNFNLGNTPPVITPIPVFGSQGDLVTIQFDLTDEESDPVDLTLQYEREDNPGTRLTVPIGHILQAPDTVTDMPTAPPSGRRHLIVWDSEQTLGTSYRQDLKIFLVVTESANAVTPAFTSPTVANGEFFSYQNSPVTVAFASDPLPPGPLPGGEYNSDVAIDITLTDAESDFCGVTVIYSTDGGVNWALATISGGTNLDTSAAGTPHTIVWHSQTNLPWFSGQVMLEIEPFDTEPGDLTALANPFDLNNRYAIPLDNLAPDAGVRFAGLGPGNRLGITVSGIGDVNGDGFADMILGSEAAASFAGESYVIFGRSAGDWEAEIGDLDLSLLDGTDGVRIPGIALADRAGYASGVGDVNGDGFADFVIGAPQGDPPGFNNGGESYLIFGRDAAAWMATAGTLDVTTLDGTNGARIDGNGVSFNSGYAVAGAGDVDADGFADFLIGAKNATTPNASFTGLAYLIFGRSPGAWTATGGVIATGSLDGNTGVRLNGTISGDETGFSVSGAGDVNADGFADVLVGANSATVAGKTSAGKTYLVFGRSRAAWQATAGEFNLGTLDGTTGVRFDGIAATDQSGRSAAGCGDVDGDGFADFLIGAPHAAPGAVDFAGQAYLIFGRDDAAWQATAGAVDLATLDGTDGVRFDGLYDATWGAGWSVAGAGDFDGDGFADLLISAHEGGPDGQMQAGEIYLIFGRDSATWQATAGVVDLDALDGTNGVRFQGGQPGDLAGTSVSGAGDVNGDGFADLLVGAINADSPGRTDCGIAYVIFGLPLDGLQSATASAVELAGDAPRMAVGISGDGSDDDSPLTRAWVDWADGDGPGGVGSVSATTVTLHRDDSALTNLPGGRTTDDVANGRWEISTDRTGFTDVTITLRYTDAEIMGLTEGNLRVFRADAESGPWTEIAGVTIDAARNTITFSIAQLGHFILAE